LLVQAVSSLRRTTATYPMNCAGIGELELQINDTLVVLAPADTLLHSLEKKGER
jgi:hypothetical protein